ncbi:MAG TPA: SRPBCC domain-containing protein [Candidatus Thermoplasmatota archaeon]|nr:SRPBCC domain-containing protein [Candidatus Thermoplasmatota archaeon]
MPAEVFALPADPTRRRAVEVPHAGELSVTDIEAKVDIEQWGASRHLRLLHEAGFVRARAEVQPVARLVYTFKAEGQPGSEITATVELRETDGATHVTLTNLCGTKEQRDAMLNYGAAAGAKAAWDRLAEVLRNHG